MQVEENVGVQVDPRLGAWTIGRRGHHRDGVVMSHEQATKGRTRSPLAPHHAQETESGQASRQLGSRWKSPLGAVRGI